MSLRAHIWAMDNAPVTNPTAALILIALADEANDDGQGAAPYMDKLVQRARCSERSVQDHLRNLFRSRLINLGDPMVARQRYRKTGGRLPRVWDLNMTASWTAVPEPRTDDEMLAYSDKIGQRPVRRSADQAERDGVQDLHPSDDPLDSGVQILHPTSDTTSDQAIQSEVDEVDQEEGCSPPHPWGAAHCTPGVQPAAPYPLVPACSPSNTPPSVQNLTLEEEPAEQEEGEDSPREWTLDETVAWFIHRRADWEQRHPGAIREALTTAVAQGLGDLRTVSSALRELAEGRHGDTGSPRRLLHADGKWWVNVRAAATVDRTASSVRCGMPGHERQPDDGCALCVGEVNACPDCPRAARKCTHTHQKVADAGEGAKWLPERLRQRAQEQPTTDAEPETEPETAPAAERELVST